MKAELTLGLRLVGIHAGTKWSTRWRAVSVLAAGAIGTFLLLALAAITAAEIMQRPHGFVESGVKVLLVTVVIAVTTPVLTLAATTARLAAATRDRQLANLRLLGLSARRTRLVAASEVGLAAVVGSLAGAALFAAARPLIADFHPAGRQWPLDTLVPHWYAAAAAVLAVPLTATLVAVVPAGGGGRAALSASRRGAPSRPHVARLAPLGLGLGLAVFVLLRARGREEDGNNIWLAPYMMVGVATLALGLLLAVPWFVRVVADVLVRLPAGPSVLIAGRRLQTQPAGLTRIVAGLLIGLFVVIGARAVVVAFEDTQQYRSAALTETIGQVGSLRVERSSAEEVAAGLRSRPDVAVVGAVALLESSTDPDVDYFSAYVATCSDLLAVVPTVRGCRDGVVTRLVARGFEVQGPAPAELRWRARADAEPSLLLPAPEAAIDDVGGVFGNAGLDGDLLVPPGLPEVAKLVEAADVELLVRAKPGSPIEDVMDDILRGDTPEPWFKGGSYPGNEYYEFVTGLRALVWAIALLVMAVGLLTFMFSGADRALGRHREATALQLVGVSPKVMRRGQFAEAAVPTAIGTALAAVLGFLAGSIFLAFGGILDLAPIRPALMITAMAVIGAVVIATALAAFAAPRIRAEHIRSE